MGVNPDLSVIIPAAGSGSRMGASVPKPYLDLVGIPVLSHTLKGFNNPELVQEIILAVASGWESEAMKCVEAAQIQVPVRLASGGAERLYSINNALKHVHPQATYVAVHDAVRPFFSTELLQRLYEAAIKTGAAIPGLPVSDTIKRVDEFGYSLETPIRTSLRAVQTPQVFGREILEKAYMFAIDHNIFATDDAALVEQYGHKVLVIEGEADNIKLTWPADFTRAAVILEQKNQVKP